MKNPERNVMESVKLNKKELLKIVLENKKKHVEEFKEAVKDFKGAAVKITQENLRLAKTGNLEKIKEIKSIPSLPVSHENDYSRAIRMLELSVEETIQLEQQIFNQLVLDEWQWKNQFSVANAMYKSFTV